MKYIPLSLDSINHSVKYDELNLTDNHSFEKDQYYIPLIKMEDELDLDYIEEYISDKFFGVFEVDEEKIKEYSLSKFSDRDCRHLDTKIYTNLRTIQLTRNVVKSCHIFIDISEIVDYKEAKKMIEEIIINSKNNEFPIYIYEEKHEFSELETEESMSLSDLLFGLEQLSTKSYQKSNERISIGGTAWDQLYLEDSYNNLSPDAKEILRQIMKSKQSLDSRLNFYFYNDKTTTEIDSIKRILKDEDMRNSEELTTKLLHKWKKLV